ncbi:uncharacterized protein LOC142583463 isoform X3 [Dermacentor variabilis]|uniref:uncharacterized protein LOC142583463 isoform X3 n=1 Tax=Dermacentor variabilis TaxID=34621 RepID=UPI003F5CB2D3
MLQDQLAASISSVQVPATPTPSPANNRYHDPEIFSGLPGEDVEDGLEVQFQEWSIAAPPLRTPPPEPC